MRPAQRGEWQDEENRLHAKYLNSADWHPTNNNRLALAALSSANPKQVLTQLPAQIADQQVFNVKIPFEGGPITNQRSSGRCWLFASTNVFRVALMRRYHLDAFEPPDGVRVLGRNAAGVQGFATDRLVAWQFHPEVKPATLGRWIAAGPGDVAAAGADPVAVAAYAEQHEERVRGAAHELTDAALAHLGVS